MSDNLLLRGQPDRALLNRNETWEVDYFVNDFNQKYGRPPSEGVKRKARHLIKTVVPGNLRSHQHIADWLLANWNNYQV